MAPRQTPIASPIDWLMEGDPVIRWQVMRDLLEEPDRLWQAERQRVATAGWGAAFLRRQRPDGSWPQGRWTGTTWTLLLLIECGVPEHLEPLRRAADLTISTLLPAGQPEKPDVLKERLDLCHVGFWLRIGAAFLPRDSRLQELVRVIAELQMPDGGWNCRIRNYPDTTHSSFHTTFNVLEGLRDAARAGVLSQATFSTIEARAIEFMLEHRLFKSDKTGRIVHESFTRLTFPSHWHYNVLRGLDYIRSTRFARDARLGDAIDLLHSKRRPNGRWCSEKRIPGVTFFDMEKPGGESRWNTLRALRVLRTCKAER